MIEINLLEKKKPFRLPVILGVDLNEVKIKPIVIAYIIQIVIDLYSPDFIKSDITALEEEFQRLSNELKVHKKYLTKNENLNELIAGFEKQIEKLKRREQEVKTVIDLKTNPKNIISAFTKIIPEDMWFDSITIDGQNDIKITGGSVSYRSVGEFMQKANELEFFNSSILIRNTLSEDESVSGKTVRVQKYSLEGKIYSFGVLE